MDSLYEEFKKNLLSCQTLVDEVQCREKYHALILAASVDEIQQFKPVEALADQIIKKIEEIAKDLMPSKYWLRMMENDGPGPGEFVDLPGNTSIKEAHLALEEFALQTRQSWQLFDNEELKRTFLYVPAYSTPKL